MLPNGDVFVGWGQQPYFTEFSASGQQIFDARFTSNTSSYRAYRMGWSGQPNTAPNIAAAPNNDGTTEVWASWNGATTVSSWRVLAGPSAGSLTPLMTARKGGFETGMAASTGMPVFEVQALGSKGQVLATSATASVGPHIGIAGRSAFVSSSGVGGLPAVCFNSSTCHIAVTITAGRTVIARTGSEQIPAAGRRDHLLHADRRRSLAARPRPGPPTARAHDRPGRLQAEIQPVYHAGPVLDQRIGAGAHAPVSPRRCRSSA